MTDIEKMLEEIKKFQEKQRDIRTINYGTDEVDNHLVFMCHSNTVRIVETALKEAQVQNRDKEIHVFASDYYTPGEVYMVKDKKIKRLMLMGKGIIKKPEKQEYTIYSNYTNYNNYTNNYTITFTNTPYSDGLWR